MLRKNSVPFVTVGYKNCTPSGPICFVDIVYYTANTILNKYLRQCACGCGSLITDKDSNKREHFYKRGHHMSGVKRSQKTVLKMSRSMIGKNTGINNSRWRDGRHKDGDGYILVLSPDHPFKNCNDRVYEHRLVMEKYLGRFLTPEEIVHHINGVRDDNRIENLRLITRSEHSIIHSRQPRLRDPKTGRYMSLNP